MRRFLFLTVAFAPFAFSCVCSHCARCATILPNIKSNFNAVVEKFLELDAQSADEFEKVLQIQAANNVLKAHIAQDMREISNLQTALVKQNLRKIYYQKKLAELERLENQVETVRKELRMTRTVLKLYQKEIK